MSARVFILVSQALLDENPPWESVGLHLVEQGGIAEPGMRWCLFDDDNAPEDLNGKYVDVTISRETAIMDSTAKIAERRVVR